MSESSGDIESLAKRVGANCKSLREASRITQDVLARYARECGLRWNAGKVAQFERGLHNPAFATILALTRALTAATDRNVGVADLVAGAGYVSIGDEEIKPTGDALAAIVRGERGWRDLVVDDVAPVGPFADVKGTVLRGLAEVGRLSAGDFRTLDEWEAVRRVQRDAGIHEARLAKRLNLSSDELARLSLKLWQRSFTQERDDRAGPDANPQKRGRVARELQTEIEREIADGHHQ